MPGLRADDAVDRQTCVFLELLDRVLGGGPEDPVDDHAQVGSAMYRALRAPHGVAFGAATNRWLTRVRHRTYPPIDELALTRSSSRTLPRAAPKRMFERPAPARGGTAAASWT